MFKVTHIRNETKKFRKHKYPNNPQHPFRAIISGSSHSGKTNLVYNLITKAYAGYFNRIIVMSPNLYIDPLYTRFVEEYALNEDDLFTEFDEEALEQLVAAQAESSERSDKGKPTEDVLLIIDDLGMDIRESKALKVILTRGRHLGISIMLVLQKFSMVPPVVRTNASDYIFTRQNNNKEWGNITSELPINKIWAEEITSKPYNFIWVDRNGVVHEQFG